MKYSALREEYNQFTFVESDLLTTPFEMFEKWFEDANKEGIKDANGMVLSTTDADGWPHGRVVLLKGVDTGFVWFTNYQSAKGRDLQLTPKASLTFWWPQLERQIRILGEVQKISIAESDEYFLSRPRGSQAGAIASNQSSVLVDRILLEKKYEDLMSLPMEAKFERPENWGGYRLVPNYFEFWQGRQSRLHDRLYYKLQNGHNWETGRLSP